jgi:hypothetical protein
METRYAVNACDLSKDTLLSQLLIGPVVPSREQVQVEKGMVDGIGILLECDTIRADAIVQVVRMKYHKNLFRFYKSTTGKSWKRV